MDYTFLFLIFTAFSTSSECHLNLGIGGDSALGPGRDCFCKLCWYVIICLKISSCFSFLSRHLVKDFTKKIIIKHSFGLVKRSQNNHQSPSPTWFWATSALKSLNPRPRLRSCYWFENLRHGNLTKDGKAHLRQTFLILHNVFLLHE